MDSARAHQRIDIRDRGVHQSLRDHRDITAAWKRTQPPRHDCSIGPDSNMPYLILMMRTALNIATAFRGGDQGSRVGIH